MKEGFGPPFLLEEQYGFKSIHIQLQGVVLGGEAVIVAESYDQALQMCKSIQPYQDEPICEDKNGSPLTKPQILHSWNGDY